MESLTEGFTKEFSEGRGVTVGLWKITEPLVLAQINYSEKSLEHFLEYDNDLYNTMLKDAKALNVHHIEQLSTNRVFDPEYAMELFKYLLMNFQKLRSMATLTI